MNILSIPSRLKLVATMVAFSFLAVSAIADEKKTSTQVASPQQIAAIGTKFRVEDCVLWRGGPGHENDNVPATYSVHVEAILEFLNNLTINEAMRAIELYCSSTGFNPKGIAQ